MKRRIPIVRNGMVHEEAEEGSSCDAIEVESAGWYDWLECHHSFRFECSTGAFTARKELRVGSWYWYAYRRQSGRLHSAYLGKSIELSLARLQVIGDALAGTANAPTSSVQVSEQVPGSPVSSVSAQTGISISQSAPMHNLPRPLTSLVGREQEAAAAGALLQRPDVRLLSMVGTGGVGKTRLALQVAIDLQERFPDGVFFVALAPLRDPQLVFSTIAQMLGLTVMGDQSFLNQLKIYLREKHCLLLLDNFEQVIEAAPQLSELLEACSSLKLLVTSREVLHLRGEHQFSVPPLALPERRQILDVQALAHVAAVELFLQQAQAIRSDFQLTLDTAAAIAEICHQLDGLPLAIELAAARVNIFAPQALLVRLERRFQVLTGGARDLPERQRTLRSAIAWSYELLPVEEQRLFRLLAVFVGGCTLEAVEAVSTSVGGSGANMLEGMVSLVDKSLLQQIGDGEGPRFTMLETIREYGQEALAACEETQAARQAHAEYFLALAEQAEPELTGPRQLKWFDLLEGEHDNLRAALSWLLEQSADGQNNELALRLIGALSPFWEIHGYVSEGWRWLEQALGASEKVRSAVRAKAFLAAAALATMQEDFGQAEMLCREGLALYRELGDSRGSATALSRWGYAALMWSNYAQARTLLEEALAIFREVGDNGGRASALHRLATVLFYQGEYAQAQALLEECRVLTREGGDIHDHALALTLLGMVLLYQGDLVRAEAQLEESLAMSRKVGYKRNLGLAITILGLVVFLQGDVARSRSLWEESLILFQEIGERGRMAEVLLSQGFIPFSQGDYVATRALVEESLQISLALNNKWDIALGLEGLATVMAAQGEPVRATWLFSAAQGLRESIGVPLPSVSQALHELTMTSVRSRLGEKAFAAAWEEGRIMTLDQVLSARVAVTIPLGTPAESSSLPYPQKVLTVPAGLTPRELEVLRLLAQGLTSAQIAERLVIGLVTVNSHVRSIYSKLGVTSRSAATRYAIEHRLV